MTPMRAIMVGPLFSTTRGQRLERGLPFLELLFGLRKLLDVFGGNLESDELAAAGQPDRIIERAFPTAISVHAAALSSLSAPRRRQVGASGRSAVGQFAKP